MENISYFDSQQQHYKIDANVYKIVIHSFFKTTRSNAITNYIKTTIFKGIRKWRNRDLLSRGKGTISFVSDYGFTFDNLCILDRRDPVRMIHYPHDDCLDKLVNSFHARRNLDLYFPCNVGIQHHHENTQEVGRFV